MRPTFPASVFLVMVLSITLPAVSLALSPSKVTLNFMCPCGSCDEALSTCECPSSDGYRSQIAGMVGSGYTEEQIIQDFKGRYGPGVLITNAAMAPNSGGQLLDKRTIGFTLLFASFILAAFGLGRYMRPSPAHSMRGSIKTRGTSAKRKPAMKSSRPAASKKRKADDIDDELFDDYNYK